MPVTLPPPRPPRLRDETRDGVPDDRSYSLNTVELFCWLTTYMSLPETATCEVEPLLVVPAVPPVCCMKVCVPVDEKPAM